MLLADAIVELLAGVFFAVVAVLMLRSLRRGGMLGWHNSLALALVSVVAVSAPHRLLRALRLFLATKMANATGTLVFPEGIVIDALVLGGLVWYAVALNQAVDVVGHGVSERHTLFADQVGLEGMRTELLALRDQVMLEKARYATVSEHLRQRGEPFDQARQAAFHLAEERLRALGASIAVLEQLARIVGG